MSSIYDLWTLMAVYYNRLSQGLLNKEFLIVMTALPEVLCRWNKRPFDCFVYKKETKNKRPIWGTKINTARCIERHITFFLKSMCVHGMHLRKYSHLPSCVQKKHIVGRCRSTVLVTHWWEARIPTFKICAYQILVIKADTGTCSLSLL
jgi:hypothetical protein